MSKRPRCLTLTRENKRGAWLKSILQYLLIDQIAKSHTIFLAAAKQLYKCYFPSVRLSVCLSVTPFWLGSQHRIIMKCITNDQSKVHAKGPGQRSKVKVTEVTTQLNRFRTVTPVWIHLWWWNDAYSLMLLRRGALLFFKVIRQISRSNGSKIVEFDPDWAFQDCNSSSNSPMATKWCTKLEVALKRCPIVYQRHPSNFKVTRLSKSSNLTQIGRFRTLTQVWIHQWLRNDAQSLK